MKDKKLNILVTGGNGQLGRCLRDASKGSSNRYIFSDINDFPGLETLRLDICNPAAVDIVADSEKIDVIVNCAGYTNVDKSEDEPELADQTGTALLHDGFYRCLDLRIGNALADGPQAAQFAQIGRGGVTGIQGKELALDIGQQVIDRGHTGDDRDLAHESAALRIPLEKFLDGDIQRDLAMHGRHDAVYRRVGEAHMRFGPGLGLVVQRGEHQFLQLRSGFQAVLAGHDVQRLLDAGGLAGGDAGCHGGRHELQDAQTHGRGDDIGSHDGLDCRVAARMDGGHAFHLNIIFFVIRYVDGVASTGVDLGQQVFYNIGKGNGIARLGEHCSDKSTADISGAKLYCMLHNLSVFFLLFVVSVFYCFAI